MQLQLTTEYRDKPHGVMTGNKNFYLVCTVTLTEEEKAIAQERGLYGYHIAIEQHPVLPRAFAAMGCLGGLGKVVLLPLGLLVFLVARFVPGGTAGGQITGLIMAIVGGFAWRYDYQSITQYEKQKLDPYQRITLGHMIIQPTFVIGADTNLELRDHEATVREQLTTLAELIRQSAPIGESNTYEL